jgi:phenylacetic acid degradation operon negative regulatory protein
MPPTQASDEPLLPLQPAKVLVEYCGAFVRRLGGWTSSRGVVAAMARIGIDEPVTRTTLSRLKQRGWLAAEQRDGRAGYALTATALRSYESGDAIIWPTREPSDLADGWVLVSVSIPESRRAIRQALRSRLTALGFGNSGPGAWVAPAAKAGAAAAVLEDLDLTDLADRFIAHCTPPQRTLALVHRGWDLRSLNDEYRRFVERFTEPVAAAGRHADDGERFALYVRLLNHWRPLAFRDPGLPLALMPADWQGEAGRALLRTAIELLDPAAMRFVRELDGTVLA